MELDLLDLYGNAGEWTATKVAAAAPSLDEPSNCPGWSVRTLLNHMLQTQKYFVDAARGHDAPAPSSTPPDALGDDPVADFNRARADMTRTFGEPGVIERTGPSFGIAFSDLLLHGWDLAVSTRHDATMPAGLAESAYVIIHGRFADDQRTGVFGPEIAVAADASAQSRLLAYTGRDPAQAPR